MQRMWVNVRMGPADERWAVVFNRVTTAVFNFNRVTRKTRYEICDIGGR